MADIVIKAENLGKMYTIGHQAERGGYTALRDVLMQNARTFWNKTKDLAMGKPIIQGDATEEVWALKDVSFEIKRGETVGIIGRNGAGKSTLLKVLSRITEPSTGRVTIKGRVASLLEVGTGFHPELSGRENIYLNGTILGMTRAEISRKFAEIVAFAEVEKYLDTPVKFYSSGMYVRLAFAVAAHLEPEILLVDEVLAVGDHEFQKKCLNKMSAVTQQGQTIIFVSHNIQAISTLTQNCMVLAQGRCAFFGPTADAIQEYLKIGMQNNAVYTEKESADVPKITYAEVKTSHPDNVQMHGEPMEIHISLSTPIPLKNAAFSFQAFNLFQQAFIYLSTFDSERSWGREPGVYHLICRIPKTRLYMGRYTLTLHFSERFGKKNPIKIEGICPFEVVMPAEQRDFIWSPNACAYIENCEWEIKKTDFPKNRKPNA